MSVSPYDLKVARYPDTVSEEEFGYLFDYSQSGALRVEAGSSQLQLTNSSGLTQSGAPYSVRDASDYWRMETTSWHAGAGQKTYDDTDSSPNKFDDSYQLDISTHGLLTLSSGMVEYTTDAPNISGPMMALGGAVFAGFGDSAYTLKYSSDNVTWTTAQTLGGPLLSLASDGDYVYAVASGVVYRGRPGGSWGAYASVSGVTDVGFAGGYIYVAKGAASVGGSTGTKAELGYLDSTLTFKSLSGAFTHCASSIAVVTIGSWVYWVAYGGGRGVVYKAQASPPEDDSFSELYQLPSGFLPTCAVGYLGTLYVGGYWETANENYGIGAVYLITDSESSLLFSIGDDPTQDSRIRSICAGGKHLYFSTKGSVYRWSISDGGYSHWLASGVAAPEGVFEWTSTQEMTTATPDTDWTETYSTPGSPFSWTLEETMAAEPTLWTITPYNSPTIAYDGVLDVSQASTQRDYRFVTYELTSDDASLSDSTGCCMEYVIPSDGFVDYTTVNGSAEVFYMTLRNGTREATAKALAVSYNNQKWIIFQLWGWNYNTSAAEYSESSRYLMSSLYGRTIRLAMKDGYAYLLVDGAQVFICGVTSKASASSKPSFRITLSGSNTVTKVSCEAIRYSNQGHNPSITAPTRESGQESASVKFFTNTTAMYTRYTSDTDTNLRSSSGACVDYLIPVDNFVTATNNPTNETNSELLLGDLVIETDTTRARLGVFMNISNQIRFGLETSQYSWAYTAYYTEDSLLGRTIRLGTRANTQSIYVDGALVLSASVGSGSAQAVIATFGAPLHPTQAGSATGFNGTISLYCDQLRYSSYSDGPDNVVTSPSYVAWFHGEAWFLVKDLGIYKADSLDVISSGWIDLSASAFHMGGVEKFFYALDVTHEPLQPGEGLSAQVRIDGNLVGDLTPVAYSVSDMATIHSWPLKATGYNARARVTITSTSSHSPRITGICFRFLPPNSPLLHTYILDCRPRVIGRSGFVWPVDPDDAISHLFSMAVTGEIGRFETRFTPSFLGRVEEATFIGAPQRDNADSQGIVQIQVREL